MNFRLNCLFIFALITLIGCKTAPKIPTFHVTMVDSCADVSAMGMFQGREYALTRPSDESLSVTGAACYSPLELSDVGKDYPASVNTELGVVTITLPPIHLGKSNTGKDYTIPQRTVHYAISAVREAK